MNRIKVPYPRLIKDYLNDIFIDFNSLGISTLGGLQEELESRVCRDLKNNIREDIDIYINTFKVNTRDQQCYKVIVNEASRTNSSVFNAITEYNLFYYKNYPYGINKGDIKKGSKPDLAIAKLDIHNFPPDLVVYWESDKKRKKDLLKKHIR